MRIVARSEMPSFGLGLRHSRAPASFSPGAKRALRQGNRPKEEGYVAHGFLGVSFLSDAERTASGGTRVDGGSEDLAQQPVVGGGFHRRLGGGEIEYGYEVFFAGSGRSNERLRRQVGGGGSEPVRVDLLLLDLYGGPYLSTMIDDRWRIYGSFGPLLQFAQWDETAMGPEEGSKGFGLGIYGRLGLERMTSETDSLGVALRWFDSGADLSGRSGDLELSGVQLVLTVTRSL